MTCSRWSNGQACAVIVTYYPESDFQDFLVKISEQIPAIVIVDNGSTGESIEMLRSLAHEGITLFELGRNTGLGVALNYGLEKVISRGFGWAVLFDQDSEPIDDMLGCFSAILSKHPEPDKIAMVGSKYVDRNKNPTANNKAMFLQNKLWVQKRRVITSGCFISLQAYKAIGPFREDFFIDAIDHEYCYRAGMKDWIVLETAIPLLSHSVGCYRKHRFLWKEIWRSHHSAMRCYFMTRNRMLLARERRHYGKLLRGGFKVLENVLLILMFEENKAAKIRATLAGYVNGVLNRAIIPDWIQLDKR